jgi:hypothetical protein
VFSTSICDCGVESIEYLETERNKQRKKTEVFNLEHNIDLDAFELVTPSNGSQRRHGIGRRERDQRRQRGRKGGLALHEPPCDARGLHGKEIRCPQVSHGGRGRRLPMAAQEGKGEHEEIRGTCVCVCVLGGRSIMGMEIWVARVQMH